VSLPVSTPGVLVKNLLIQLDSSPFPSSFDQVVAYDGGADQIMSYGNVTEAAVRDLVHGAIFTRGPRDLHHTAIFIGGTDMAAGERILGAVKKSVFGPMRVSVLLDSNGSNTTAVAAVAKLQAVAGDVTGKRVVVTAGTGPVGIRAAGLLAKAGADVVITSRKPMDPAALDAVRKRFVLPPAQDAAGEPPKSGGSISNVVMADSTGAAQILEGAQLLLNCGPAGVTLVPRAAWAGRPGLIAAADLNAVPPLGIDGIEVMDNATPRDGVSVFGALGVGGLKMKIHKACIAKLFERNDQVFDAESIAEVAKELSATK
jgi:methylenetetrahydrofolate/methylenetetrahydromethanopterin dehydrogenase (NADP+)